MAYRYGANSRLKLDTCHPGLKEIAFNVLKRSPYDITILHGWRSKDQQNALYDSGASQVQWPDSEHNYVNGGTPESLALDFAPWLDGFIPWHETHIFACIAGIFISEANRLGYKLRWGGDWDADGNTKEHKLQDWGHVELVLGDSDV